MDIRLDALKDLPVRKIGMVAIMFIGVDYLYTSFHDEEMAKATQVLEQYQARASKLAAEVSATKGFEAVKAEIDAAEQAVKTKLDVVEKLVADRQIPPKLLSSIASMIPEQAWLTGVKVAPDQAMFMGNASSLAVVTDFMKSLEESSFFKEVDAKAGSAKDKDGSEMASFELTAKRR
jgi:Tfp pilus assembly protein PilN